MSGSLAAGIGSFSLGAYGFEKNSNLNFPLEPNSTVIEIKLSLQKLQDRYHSDLFDDFIPHMDQFVIDHQNGGFMCSVDISNGKQVNSNKTAWFEGRGMWTYSFLYNHFGKNPKYLEVARKSKDFILKLQPKDNSFWTSSFDREEIP